VSTLKPKLTHHDCFPRPKEADYFQKLCRKLNVKWLEKDQQRLLTASRTSYEQVNNDDCSTNINSEQHRSAGSSPSGRQESGRAGAPILKISTSSKLMSNA